MCKLPVVYRARQGKESRSTVTSDGETVFREYDGSFENKGTTPSAVLIVLKGLDIGKRYRLNEEVLVLGRSAHSADIVIPDPAVSGRHCRIDALPHRKKYVVTDLESRNGTWLNGKRVRRGLLRDGDKLVVGDTVLKFAFLDEIEDRFHSELSSLAETDALTGLVTLRVFDRELRRRFADYPDESLSVLMMDMDGLKKINDAYGHQAGAYCVAEVGRIIGKTVANLGTASRFGGDEFTAFLVGMNVEEAEKTAERIRREVERHLFQKDGVRLTPTISIGVAQRTADTKSPEELIRAADDALYRAKRSGRNTVSR